MNRNTNRNRRRNNRRLTNEKSASDTERVVAVLRRIERLEESSSDYPPPLVPDILPMSIARDKIFTIVRNCNIGTITGSSTTDQTGAYALNLSSFPNSSDFTNLFDEYRIIQIVFEFIPQSTNGQSTPLYTVIDPDDSQIPIDATAMRQYDTCMMVPPDKYFRRIFTPKFSLAAYNGAFTGYGNQSPFDTWLDTNSPGVLHYGLKYFLPFQTGNNASWSVQCTAVLQFRHPY